MDKSHFLSKQKLNDTWPDTGNGGLNDDAFACWRGTAYVLSL